MTVGAERARMADAGHPEDGWREASPWYQWGPYLSERAWGWMAESETYAHLEHLRLAGVAERHDRNGEAIFEVTGVPLTDG